MIIDLAIAHMSDVVPPGGTQPLIVRIAMQPKTHDASHPSDESAGELNDHYQSSLSTPVPHKISQGNPSAMTVTPVPIISSQTRAPHHAAHIPNQSYHQLGVPLTSTLPQPPPVEAPRSAQYMIYVTFDNVPPTFDIMSFIFLANYGQVIEGKAETQDFQIYHDGLPYLYRTYTGVYSFTLIVDKDRDISNLMGLNMAMVAIQGHYLQVY